jgi:Peptidase inhibitor family I36
MRRTRIIGALAGALVAVAWAGALAPGASAAATDCPARTTICWFEGAGFSGPMSTAPALLAPPAQIPDLRTATFPDGKPIASNVSSVVNHSTHPLVLFTAVNASGSFVILQPNSSSNLDAQFNHHVLSAIVLPAPSDCVVNTICTFSEQGGLGARGVLGQLTKAPFQLNNMNTISFPGGTSLGKSISSAINRTSRDLVMFTGIDDTGLGFLVPPNTEIDLAPAVDDRVQSALTIDPSIFAAGLAPTSLAPTGAGATGFILPIGATDAGVPAAMHSAR